MVSLEFFIDLILPAAPMALESTRLLIEMRIRRIFWGVGCKVGRCVGLTTWPPSCADCLEFWNPQGLSRAVQELLYLLLDVKWTFTKSAVRSSREQTAVQCCQLYYFVKIRPTF